MFITGTDTGVGKTFVTCGLLEVLQKHKTAVRVIKPFATGARLVEGHWVSPDAEEFAAHLEGKISPQDLENLCFYAWPSPLSPYSAQVKGEEPLDIDWKGLSLRLAEMRRHSDVLLVEGIGGVAVPLSKDKVAADLATAAGAAALVVSENRLGCINHTLLTLEFLKGRHIPVAGFLFNEPRPPQEDQSQSSNAQIIQSLSGVPYLGHLPYGTAIRSLFTDIARKIDLLS